MADENGQQNDGGQQTDNGGSAGGTNTGGQQQNDNGGASRTGATSGFTYAEDRSQWIPPHRMRETSERTRTLESQLQEANRKVAALSGTQPADPKAEKSEQVRQAMFEMFPWAKRLSDLSDEQIDRLLAAPDGADRARAMEEQQWKRHSDTQMATVYSDVASAIGADKLSEDQQTDLRDSFARWLRATCTKEIEASGGAESKTLARYEAGDPSLMKEFAKRYLGNWVEPARRKATAQNATRTRAVPNAGGRQQMTQTGRPEKFNSIDERLDYAAKVMRSAGGFGG